MPLKDLYTEWLGIPDGPRPPTARELLGLPMDTSDPTAIEEAVHKRMESLDRYAGHSDPVVRDNCARMMNEVALARNTLIAEAKSAKQAPPAEPAKVSPPPPTREPPLRRAQPVYIYPLDSGATRRRRLILALTIMSTVSLTLVVAYCILRAPAPQTVSQQAISPPQAASLTTTTAPAGPAMKIKSLIFKKPAVGDAVEGTIVIENIGGLIRADPYRLGMSYEVAVLDGTGHMNARHRGGWGPTMVPHQTITMQWKMPGRNSTNPLEVSVPAGEVGKGPMTIPAPGKYTVQARVVFGDLQTGVLDVVSESFEVAQGGLPQASPVPAKIGDTITNSIGTKPPAGELLPEHATTAPDPMKAACLAKAAEDLAEAEAHYTEMNGEWAFILLRDVNKLDPGNVKATALLRKINRYYLPRKIGEPWTNSIDMTLVYIPAGEFVMGSPENEVDRSNDERQHRVRLTKDFIIGATEVTQKQWMMVMGPDNNPSRFKGDDLPVQYVSWDDAKEFCRKLSKKDRLKYRLPTEAEWEYACRAGTKTRFSGGDAESNLVEEGWFWNNQAAPETVHAVGLKRANAWGLYDMHGNVREWCEDCFAEYSKDDLVVDPTGPIATNNHFGHVSRGGSWTDLSKSCTAANRGADCASGLRVVSSEVDDTEHHESTQTAPATQPFP